jgi:hypothetical protein
MSRLYGANFEMTAKAGQEPGMPIGQLGVEECGAHITRLDDARGVIS